MLGQLPKWEGSIRGRSSRGLPFLIVDSPAPLEPFFQSAEFLRTPKSYLTLRNGSCFQTFARLINFQRSGFLRVLLGPAGLLRWIL